MLKKILVNLKSEYGAMDRILVTLLLVVVSIAALVAIESWVTSNKEMMINTSNDGISNIVNSS